MEIKKSLFLILVFVFPLLSFSQFGANIDYKNVAAVNENTALVTGMETIHNIELDHVQKLKARIAKYSGTMAALKTLYAASLSNIDGFDSETQLYKDIILTAADIFSNVPVALEELSKRPYSALACGNDVSNLVLEATSAASTFVNVVTNGRASFKLKDLNTYGTGDGYNYLNRSDRYTMANNILTTLTDVKYRLEGIIYIARFCNGISDLVYALDIDTWYNVVTGISIAEGIISDYNSFSL